MELAPGSAPEFRSYQDRVLLLDEASEMEPKERIELSYPRYKGGILPLNYFGEMVAPAGNAPASWPYESPVLLLNYGAYKLKVDRRREFHPYIHTLKMCAF